MGKISISLRLTLWLSIVFLCGFVVFGAVMWADLSYSLASGRDRTLTRRATRTFDLLYSLRDASPQRRVAKFEEFAEDTPEGNLIRVIDEHGHRLYPGIERPAGFPVPKPGMLTSDRFSNVEFGGRAHRILEHPAVLDSQRVLIVIGGQLTDNRQMVSRFQTGLFAAIPALLAVSALAGYFMSRRVLRPVGRITAAVRSISIGNLCERLPVHGAGDELQCLAETCNDMLARLEASVARINRFTADASHELRSPISFIRMAAEHALRNPKLDTECKQAFQDVLAESTEAGRLLEDMLTLARADASRFELSFARVDLGKLLEDTCEKMRTIAGQKRQTLTVDTGQVPVVIHGDRAHLRRLVSILLDNAVKYTPEGGRIEAALARNGMEARLRVEDNGIGIPAELLPRVFERFFRADPSRSNVDGAGLGLAMAKWIADAHRATLPAESVEGQGSVFTVVFPLDR
ncbi:MAG: ATP-binding protein [Bryobacteraceae bacterium]